MHEQMYYDDELMACARIRIARAWMAFLKKTLVTWIYLCFSRVYPPNKFSWHNIKKRISDNNRKDAQAGLPQKG
jgi:hypothetical protein